MGENWLLKTALCGAAVQIVTAGRALALLGRRRRCRDKAAGLVCTADTKHDSLWRRRFPHVHYRHSILYPCCGGRRILNCCTLLRLRRRPGEAIEVYINPDDPEETYIPQLREGQALLMWQLMALVLLFGGIWAFS